MEQMKIKIKNPYDEQSIYGKNILRMYPDQSTPILDLFVRESIQNSLDAAQEGKGFVHIDYTTGDFDSRAFCKSLEGVNGRLSKIYPNEEYRYFSVRDTNTEGLTGKTCKEDVVNYEKGNYIKLVIDVCEPQEKKEAGGSWGLGKVIYFRLGIGLVFYYSRIFNKETDQYESRLAGCLIEDQTNPHAVLTPDKQGMSSGIAWWGRLNDRGYSIPITDEEQIKEFLGYFHIEPFGDSETGTQVIIPYVNERQLLSHNREDIENVRKKDLGTIEGYLELAVQKWYFPRLNNRRYKNGRYLTVSFNGRDLNRAEMIPFFRIYQGLYNLSCLDGYVDEYLEEQNVKTYVDVVEGIRKYDYPVLGKVASAVVTKEMLNMLPPENERSPYELLGQEPDIEENPPILTFCRRPGMCISYKDRNGAWLKNIPPCDPDKFILAIFVLNSETHIGILDLSLEEYIRKSELANHDNWEDYAENGASRPTFIKSIKSGTRAILKKHYCVEKEYADDNKRNSGLGHLLAKYILPPVGFGKKSSRNYGTKKAVAKTEFTTQRNISYGLQPRSTIYEGNTLTFSYEVKTTGKAVNGFEMYFEIGSESSNISAQAWEDSGLQIPFVLNRAKIELTDSLANNEKVFFDFKSIDESLNNNKVVCMWKQTKSNTKFGIEVLYQEQMKFIGIVTLTIEIQSKELQPVIMAAAK